MLVPADAPRRLRSLKGQRARVLALLSAAPAEQSVDRSRPPIDWRIKVIVVGFVRGVALERDFAEHDCVAAARR